MTIATQTTALVAAVAAYGQSVIDRRIKGGQFIGRAYTKPVAVLFSATPAIDPTLSNVFNIGTLTGNITALTLPAGGDGQTITVGFQQDAAGNHTVALPANTQVSGTLALTANAVTLLVLTYNVARAKWEGSWVAVQ